jgi:hypothetical protein
MLWVRLATAWATLSTLTLGTALCTMVADLIPRPSKALLGVRVNDCFLDWRLSRIIAETLSGENNRLKKLVYGGMPTAKELGLCCFTRNKHNPRSTFRKKAPIETVTTEISIRPQALWRYKILRLLKVTGPADSQFPIDLVKMWSESTALNWRSGRIDSGLFSWNHGCWMTTFVTKVAALMLKNLVRGSYDSIWMLISVESISQAWSGWPQVGQCGRLLQRPSLLECLLYWSSLE